MISEKLFKTLLSVAVVLTGLHLVILGKIAPENVTSITAPVGVVSFLILGFLGLLDKYLWKWPVVHSCLRAPPIMNGTWKGVLQSNWRDKKTGQVVGPIEVYAVVRQTLSTIDIKMFTAQMASDTLVTTIKTDNHAVQILATYQSIPHLQFQPESRTHFGGFLVGVVGSPASSIDGHYWTDRETQGTLLFEQKHKTLAQNFVTAKSLFS